MHSIADRGTLLTRATATRRRLGDDSETGRARSTWGGRPGEDLVALGLEGGFPLLLPLHTGKAQHTQAAGWGAEQAPRLGSARVSSAMQDCELHSLCRPVYGQAGWRQHAYQHNSKS